MTAFALQKKKRSCQRQHEIHLPDVLLLVFFSDQLVLAVVLQLVSGNLPEDLHVLSKIKLHAALLQVVFSAHTHKIV